MSEFRTIAIRLAILSAIVMGAISLTNPTEAQGFSCLTACRAAKDACITACNGNTACNDQCLLDYGACIEGC